MACVIYDSKRAIQINERGMEMVLEIKKIALENFKGAKNVSVDFDGDTVIKGENGAGKTTLATAFYWVFGDCDTNLVKNPVVTPIGAEECVSKVTIDLLIDGKPCQVAKSQKYKEKTDDAGKKTSKVDNSYEINSVDKKYKDFVADLEERGIDMERFLIFTNPNAFTQDTSKAGREKMREVLFEMANDVSDIELANELNFEEISTLLESYKLDEIKSINKSTIKKITDNNGKDNEIINSRIQGIIDSKSNIDIKQLKNNKSAYEKEIADIEAAMEDFNKVNRDKKAKINELKDKLTDIERKANAKYDKEYNDLQAEKRIAEKAYNDAFIEIDNLENKINREEINLETQNESLENYRGLYKKVQNEVFDPSDTCCPTCGREYEPERIDVIKSDFERGKTDRLNAYKKNADEIKTDIKSIKNKIDEMKKDHESKKKAFIDCTDEVETIREKLQKLKKPDMDNNKTYQKTLSEIKTI